MGRDFPPVQTGPGAKPASCTVRTGSFPGVKYGRGALLTTHPLLVPWSWKSSAIHLPTLWATTGPVTGTLYLFIILLRQVKTTRCLLPKLSHSHSCDTWKPHFYKTKSHPNTRIRSIQCRNKIKQALRGGKRTALLFLQPRR